MSAGSIQTTSLHALLPLSFPTVTFHIRRLEEKRKPGLLQKLWASGSAAWSKMRASKWYKVIAIGLTIAEPLYALGVRMYERRKREQRMKRVVALSAAVITVAGILLLTFILLVRMGALSLQSLIEMGGAPIASDAAGMTNILLLGQGNEEHDGIDLTDTIIVASLDPKNTRSVALLSFPRDLYFLHTDAMQTKGGKLNALWRDNRILHQRAGKDVREASLLSLQELKTELGDTLGIPIHYAAKVDFTAFEQVIDTLGGIDIVVPETIHDTSYPGPNYSYQTFHIDAGPQHLNGAMALQYARTRSTTSDFDRSARQQQILQAAGEKARAAGILTKPTTIGELLSILSEHLETDLTVRQMVSLASTAKKLDPKHIITMQLNNINGLYEQLLEPGGLLYAPPRELFEGASVLLPVSIPEFPVTWKQIHVLGKLLFHERHLYLAHPRITILNAGAPEGSARNLGRELIKFGFDVLDIANIPQGEDTSQSLVLHISTDKGKELTEEFSHLLRIPMADLSVQWQERLEGIASTDIVIVLGKDYTFRRFQDLLSLSST